jgi:IS5 family transposase
VDPDARTGKKTGTKWEGYKAHIVMEEESGIITEVATTPANATDGSQLQPLLKEQEKVHSLAPQVLQFDRLCRSLTQTGKKMTIGVHHSLDPSLSAMRNGEFTLGSDAVP